MPTSPRCSQLARSFSGAACDTARFILHSSSFILHPRSSAFIRGYLLLLLGLLHRRSSAFIRGCLLLFLGLLAGCTGSGDIRFVSLQPREIDPPTTEVWTFPAQECYWWVDDGGDLNIALKSTRRNFIMGKYGDVDFQMSLALDQPPAGSGRNYSVGGRETRSLFVSALQSMRLSSNMGIVGVSVRDDGTLAGDFRIWMTPRTELQVFSFMPQDPGGLLCFGTFRALKDEKRGQAIRAYCEANGWPRPPKTPTSAPTTSAPAASVPAAPTTSTSPTSALRELGNGSQAAFRRAPRFSPLEPGVPTHYASTYAYLPESPAAPDPAPHRG